MMKTITVLAWRRPAYLRRVLEALAKCRGLSGYEVRISVDGPIGDFLSDQCFSVASAFPFGKAIQYMSNVGVDDHPFRSIGMAFSSGSEFNLHIEDDVVPAPDALELANWFYEHGREYACLLLHGGTTDQSNPLALNEISRFCPWGWATTREMWERWWKPNWNCKINEPCRGWDFSMGLVIQRNGLKCLKPALSRTLNIGREGGVYETPGHWDEWASRLVASDGTHGTEYQISGRLPHGYEMDVDSWVKEAVCR
jgi:hypothetical protein